MEITSVIYNTINTKSKIVHSMNHPSTTLCGIHKGFGFQNPSLEKTNKKTTCKKCLRVIKMNFQYWDMRQNLPKSRVESFDEEIHSSQITERHIFE